MVEVSKSLFVLYLATGVVFAVPFAMFGARRVDPAAATAGWGFRLLIVPGATVFWPLLLVRWIRRKQPVECTEHRCAVPPGDS